MGPVPEATAWSPGETAAHVLLSERALFAAIRRALATPPNPDWETITAGKTAFIERVLVERSTKVSAPERLLPQLLSREELVSNFETARERVIRFARETTANLHEHTAEYPMPVFGVLNAYQWLLYIPLHTLRHTAQILEAK